MSEHKPDETIAESTGKVCNDVDECVRNHPGTALAIAIGAGLAFGLLVRMSRPAPVPTARQRIQQLLEDFEIRLKEVSDPALSRAGSFVSEKADVIRDSIHSSEKGVESLIHDIGQRLRKLFH